MNRETPFHKCSPRAVSAGTQSVVRALRIVRAFSDARAEWSLAELSRELALSKPTAFRLLGALEQAELVTRTEPAGAYRLGPGAIELGARAQRSNTILSAARPELEALTRDTGETSSVEILAGAMTLILDEVLGGHLIGTSPAAGTRWPAHAASTGKVLLAAAQEEEPGIARRLARGGRRAPAGAHARHDPFRAPGSRPSWPGSAGRATRPPSTSWRRATWPWARRSGATTDGSSPPSRSAARPLALPPREFRGCSGRCASPRCASPAASAGTTPGRRPDPRRELSYRIRHVTHPCSLPAAAGPPSGGARPPGPAHGRRARAGALGRCPAQGLAGDRRRRRSLGRDDAPVRRAGRRPRPGAHRGRADGERGSRRVGRRDGGRARQPWRARRSSSWWTAPRPTRRSFVHRLDSATGIWFCGGDQARLTDVLGGTASLRAIHARYQAGAVVGGTSAGAAIMSDSMITGDQTPPGDTTGYYGDEYPTIERRRIEVTPGLGFLHGAIVDQHFLRRERHNRLLSAVLERPGLLGVGIDESTAIEVSPDGRWHVLGESDVIVYDARHARVTAAGAPLLGATDIRVHLLPSGSVYDPAERPCRPAGAVIRTASTWGAPMHRIRTVLSAAVAVLLALTLASSALEAQTGTIRGTVTDSATQSPLQGARVAVVGGTRANRDQPERPVRARGRRAGRSPGAGPDDRVRARGADGDGPGRCRGHGRLRAGRRAWPSSRRSWRWVTARGSARELSSAVSSVSAADLAGQPIASVDGALQGKAAGRAGDPERGQPRERHLGPGARPGLGLGQQRPAVRGGRRADDRRRI